MTPQELETVITTKNAEIDNFIKKANDEIAVTGKTATDTKTALDKLAVECKDLMTRLFAIEQNGAKGTASAERQKSIGETVVESAFYKSMKENGASRSGQIKLGSLFGTKDIVNATGVTTVTQPLVAPMMAPMIQPITRRLTVRDLLPTGRTTSNLILYPKENVFTDSAAPIYQAAIASPATPAMFENVLKPKSDITFTQGSAPVQTVGHYLKISKQMLDDAPMLSDYIDTRMLYGLKLAEETQLLTGDGTGANLNGLITQATAYDTTLNVTGDTDIDKLRHAIYQVRKSELNATGIIMNPLDLQTMELTKTTGTASSGQYIYAFPQAAQRPTMWGLPIVDTNSMPAGKFLVADYAMGAQIWDRQDATVEVSREDQDNFVRNMATVLVEERLALTVYRPLAFIYGTF